MVNHIYGFSIIVRQKFQRMASEVFNVQVSGNVLTEHLLTQLLQNNITHFNYAISI